MNILDSGLAAPTNGGHPLEFPGGGDGPPQGWFPGNGHGRSGSGIADSDSFNPGSGEMGHGSSVEAPSVNDDPLSPSAYGGNYIEGIVGGRIDPFTDSSLGGSSFSAAFARIFQRERRSVAVNASSVNCSAGNRCSGFSSPLEGVTTGE